MNIILVSATERTHEIGIGKAIGARTTDSLVQFLLHAATLSGMSGLAGIAFGRLISTISRAVFQPLPASVPVWSAIVGIVCPPESASSSASGRRTRRRGWTQSRLCLVRLGGPCPPLNPSAHPESGRSACPQTSPA